MWLEILVAKLATNFQDLVAKVKTLVALVPVLGAILRPGLRPLQLSFDKKFFKGFPCYSSPLGFKFAEA